MDDVQLLKIRLHPGQTDRFVAFARGLTDRSAEVQASLRLEGVRLETLFIERTAEADFIYFYSRAASLAAAAAAFASSTLPLDQETKTIITESWDTVGPLEVLVDLTAAGICPDP